MCGIVGAFPINKKNLEIDEKQRRLLMLYLHNEVLLETVARGKDATGIALSFGPDPEKGGDPFWCVLKQPVDTSDFFTNDGTASRYRGQDEEANIERAMDVACLLDRRLNHVLGHTRAKTVGSEYNPLNNHPILVGNIIGIHNGGVKNYERVYKKHENMTPQGEVDSEVIFQLLAEVANDRAVSIDDINYVTERIEGARAVIAYNRKYPDKVIFFHDKERPMELAYIKELGVAIIHSEKRFLNTALHAYHRMRLSICRDLPELSCEFRHIPSGEGGIIDINAEVDDEELSVEKIFPLVKCADTLKDYGKSYSTTNNTTGYNNHTAHRQTGFQTGTGTGSTSSSSGTGTTGSTGAGVAGKSTSSSAATKVQKPKIASAQLTDLSDYAAESGEKPQMQSVEASAVMDDDEDDFENDEIEVTNSVADVYSEEELRNKGAEWALSEEAKKNKGLYVNRHEGNFAKVLSVKGMTEDEAAEVIHQLYPEIASEGFAEGFRQGAEEQADSQEEDELQEQNEALLEDNKNLQDRLLKERTRQKRAAAYFANLKAFFIAAILTKNLARVEGEGSNARLVFDEELEDFIATARGFRKVNPELVREIFTEQDLAAIDTGLVKLSRSIRNPNGEALTKAKTIKS